MFIQINFKDKNPYIKFCSSEEEIRAEKRRWMRDYILREVLCTPSPYGKNYFYSAVERTNSDSQSRGDQ